MGKCGILITEEIKERSDEMEIKELIFQMPDQITGNEPIFTRDISDINSKKIEELLHQSFKSWYFDVTSQSDGYYYGYVIIPNHALFGYGETIEATMLNCMYSFIKAVKSKNTTSQGESEIQPVDKILNAVLEQPTIKEQQTTKEEKFAVTNNVPETVLTQEDVLKMLEDGSLGVTEEPPKEFDSIKETEYQEMLSDALFANITKETKWKELSKEQTNKIKERVQEFKDSFGILSDEMFDHYVGSWQTGKTKKTMNAFETIHFLDWIEETSKKAPF